MNVKEIKNRVVASFIFQEIFESAQIKGELFHLLEMSFEDLSTKISERKEQDIIEVATLKTALKGFSNENLNQIKDMFPNLSPSNFLSKFNFQMTFESLNENLKNISKKEQNKLVKFLIEKNLLTNDCLVSIVKYNILTPNTVWKLINSDNYQKAFEKNFEVTKKESDKKYFENLFTYIKDVFNKDNTNFEYQNMKDNLTVLFKEFNSRKGEYYSKKEKDLNTNLLKLLIEKEFDFKKLSFEVFDMKFDLREMVNGKTIGNHLIENSAFIRFKEFFLKENETFIKNSISSGNYQIVSTLSNTIYDSFANLKAKETLNFSKRVISYEKERVGQLSKEEKIKDFEIFINKIMQSKTSNNVLAFPSLNNSNIELLEFIDEVFGFEDYKFEINLKDKSKSVSLFLLTTLFFVLTKEELDYRNKVELLEKTLNKLETEDLLKILSVQANMLDGMAAKNTNKALYMLEGILFILDHANKKSLVNYTEYTSILDKLRDIPEIILGENNILGMFNGENIKRLENKIDFLKEERLKIKLNFNDKDKEKMVKQKI